MPNATSPTPVPLVCTGAGEGAPVQADRLIAGNPSPVAWNGYTDAT